MINCPLIGNPGTARRVLFAIASAAALALVAASGVSAQVSDREIPIGNATSLRFNVSGSVRVMPVAGMSSIKLHVVDNGPSTPPMSIRTSRTGARLNVSVNGPGSAILPFVGQTGYELQLMYPPSLHLDLREFEGRIHVENVPASMQLYDADGDIVVDGTQAPLTADADGGNITVTAARSTLTLTAGTGDVAVTLAPGWRGSEVRLEASDGNLALNVPAGFRGRYDLTSGSGNVKNPLRSVPKAPLVFMLTEQGNVSIQTL
ncbi:MAG TPA: hypothetical protein VMA98_11485 [Candidatus Acidoferrales bacterium]|nr:hypothetical protein [Candidatus Acidoferrales bacterium]